jgi:acyl-CoA dehydrogenase
MSGEVGSSEELDLIVETARQIMAATPSEEVATVRRLSDAGLMALALPEPDGGGWLAAAAAVVRLSGELAIAGGYADSALVGGPLLSAAGLDVGEGWLTASEAVGEVRRDGDRLRVDVGADRVAWASSADHLVLVLRDGDEELVARVAAADATITPGRNLAGESRDVVQVSAPIGASDWALLSGASAELRARGALARAAAMAGAAAGALAYTVTYAGERVQFGRPIARFQVVQHFVAELAVEVEAMSAATAAAVDVCALDGFGTDRARFAVAVAKAQTSASAGVVARIAHQVHGAIGTTQEHPLHHTTTRLWSWREEFGGEPGWQAELGQAALDADVWDVLT